MTKKDFEYAKRFEDWLKGKNLNGIQEDVLKLRIENEKLKEINSETIAQLNLNNGELIIENEKLQKENAELKEELKDANEKVVHLACNQNKDLKYKLTEAKEIIDNFLDFESSCQERGIYISDEIREKANKFLEEE